MKAIELRIWNWCTRTNKKSSEKITIQLTASCILDISSNGENSSFVYEPIPLTEKWLLKLGFYMENKSYFFLPSRTRTNKSNKTFEYTKDLNLDWYILLDDSTRIYLEYVHQFQNLYFALTNEELTINDNH